MAFTSTLHNACRTQAFRETAPTTTVHRRFAVNRLQQTSSVVWLDKLEIAQLQAAHETIR
jgi:hypothetical protein